MRSKPLRPPICGGTPSALQTGGQHVNKTDSAIRITHLPPALGLRTGRAPSQEPGESFSLLASRLQNAETERQQKSMAETARARYSGDRSERIRTNFPGRLRPRINLTLDKSLPATWAPWSAFAAGALRVSCSLADDQ